MYDVYMTYREVLHNPTNNEMTPAQYATVLLRALTLAGINMSLSHVASYVDDTFDAGMMLVGLDSDVTDDKLLADDYNEYVASL